MNSENGRSRTPRPTRHKALAAFPASPSGLTDELSRSLRPKLLPLNDQFSYFLAVPVAEEDLNQYLHEPIAALPSAVCELLPKVAIVLAPWLQQAGPKGSVSIVQDKPAEPELLFSTRVEAKDFATLFFAIKGEQVSDYHYYLYDEIAAMVSHRWPETSRSPWYALLREELTAEVHGEVDEKSWNLKQTVLSRPEAGRNDGKPFRDYARQAFEDTMTLYLHGLCCDIDVETGPRQLPSRHMRKRLEYLKTSFPPPEGHAVFPEDVVHHTHSH